MRGRDQLAVSVSLRWFPVSELRKSVCLRVSIYSIFLHARYMAVCGRPAAWLRSDFIESREEAVAKRLGGSGSGVRKRREERLMTFQK